MLRPLTFNWLIQGTLAANETFDLVFPFDVQLLAVYALASNDSDATLMIGTSADTDGYMAAAVIGDSGAFATFDRDNFTGALSVDAAGVGQYPHVSAGTVVRLTLDYDGAAGTAADDLEMIAVFSEG